MFVAISLFLISWFITPTNVQASTTNNHVLLVYDSQNTATGAAKKIDTLQRSLTSMNLQVKTVDQSKYKKGELNNHYLGVITMINWRELGLINHEFISDRAKFSGIKLHIGQNLSQSEIKELGGSVQKLYRQQFNLKNNDNEQLLPFINTMTIVNKTEKAQQIGTLVTQQSNQQNYPFGIIKEKAGYLPFFDTSGLSLMLEIQLIGQLFHRVGTYQPLLTFTKVTPYSDLRMIDELSRYCDKNGIPFAISTTSVSQNTNLKAFNRFTATLRNVESRGGIIFLNAPEVSSTNNSGTLLSQQFSTYIVTLSQHQVFPVGVSAEGFWNQDQVLRTNFLQYANHWLMLPSQSQPNFVKQDNDAQAAKESYFGMSMSSLKKKSNTSDIQFSIPTALTIPLPNTDKDLATVKRDLQRNDFAWYDAVSDGLTTKIETPSSLLEYKYGNYYANGKHEEVQISNSSLNKQFGDNKPKATLSRYFKVQGHIFMTFFIIVTIILLVFIYLGQKVYWNRMRRKK